MNTKMYNLEIWKLDENGNFTMDDPYHEDTLGVEGSDEETENTILIESELDRMLSKPGLAPAVYCSGYRAIVKDGSKEVFVKDVMY